MANQLERDVARLEKEFDAYSSQQEARGLITRKYAAYHDDPVGFIRDALGGDPWSRQEEIAEAVRDFPEVAVRSNNSMGKDWLAARLALWWICTRHDGLVLMTGPTFRQVTTILMRENVRGAALGAVKSLPGLVIMDGAARIDGVDRILAFTSSEANKLTGFHKGRILVIITEAQGVEEFAFEGLSACATGEDDRILLVGNPMRKGGRFYRACQPNSGWHAFKVTANEHPNVVTGKTIIPGGPTRRWVERTRRDEVESISRSRIDAEFPTESAEALCQMRWLEKAAKADHLHGPLKIGIDPARSGKDSTCVAIARGDTLIALHVWNSDDLMVTCGMVVELLVRLSVERDPESGLADFLGHTPIGAPSPGAGVTAQIRVDEIGLGAGLVDRLRELGYGIEAFNSGHAARWNETFLNKRAEFYWNLRDRLEAGLLRGALFMDEELAEELTTMEWQLTSAGKKKMEPKAELKVRLGRSPDKADAVSMAMGDETLPEFGGEDIPM